MPFFGSSGVDYASRKSWVCQRILNNLPISENARRLPFSLTQQLINPIALEIQDTYQQLSQARANSFLSSFNIVIPSSTWFLDLDSTLEFDTEDVPSGEVVYVEPYVYATYDGSTSLIDIAPDNDMESFIENHVPTRVRDENVSHSYQEVLPRTLVSDIPTTSLNDIVVEGHLYVTVRDNKTWRNEYNDIVYFPKVRITGVTRKRTEVTEEIPIQQNGTYKTINQWRSVSEVEIYYLDSTSYVTVESFPFDAEYLIDFNNLYISNNDREMFQYFTIEENSSSGGFDLMCYVDTLEDIDMIQALNFPKDIVFNMGLASIGGFASSASLVMSPYPNISYVVDNYELHVYDIRMPLPDFTKVNEDSPESNIDIYADKWVVQHGETVRFSTRLLDNTNPPFRFRIKVVDDSSEDWLGLDGSRYSTSSVDGWIQNERWDENLWEDKTFSFEIEEYGETIITFEVLYSNETTSQVYTRKSQFLFFAPYANSEKSLSLPTDLRNSDNVAYDSDGNLWFYDSGSGTIRKATLHYDYFLIDYENKRLWVREQYDKIRVDV